MQHKPRKISSLKRQILTLQQNLGTMSLYNRKVALVITCLGPSSNVFLKQYSHWICSGTTHYSPQYFIIAHRYQKWLMHTHQGKKLFMF